MKLQQMIVQWTLKTMVLSVLLFVAGISNGSAYEVWLTDQSDTGKEGGGYLYIYDGAQLAANASSAKPSQTIDFSADLGKFCEEATKKPVRRPHMRSAEIGRASCRERV